MIAAVQRKKDIMNVGRTVYRVSFGIITNLVLYAEDINYTFRNSVTILKSMSVSVIIEFKFIHLSTLVYVK